MFDMEFSSSDSSTILLRRPPLAEELFELAEVRLRLFIPEFVVLVYRADTRLLSAEDKLSVAFLGLFPRTVSFYLSE